MMQGKYINLYSLFLYAFSSPFQNHLDIILWPQSFVRSLLAVPLC